MHLSKGRANGFKLPGGALSTEHRCNEPPDAIATEVWAGPTSADGLRLVVMLDAATGVAWEHHGEADSRSVERLGAPR